MRITDKNTGEDFTRLVIDLFEMKITSEEFNEIIKKRNNGKSKNKNKSKNKQ